MEVRRSGPRDFSLKRRFRGIVPVDWRHDHRVELDNQLPIVNAELPADARPQVVWRTRIYLGYAIRYKCYELKLAPAIALARATVTDAEPVLENSRLSRTLLSVAQAASNGFPDAVTLQEEWSGWRSGSTSPVDLLQTVANAVNSGLPSETWGKLTIPHRVTSPLLTPTKVMQGKEVLRGQPVEMSVRLLAAAAGLSILTARLNGYGAGVRSVLDALLSRRGLVSHKLDSLVLQGTPAGSARPIHPLAH